jgi:hypothetical protein
MDDAMEEDDNDDDDEEEEDGDSGDDENDEDEDPYDEVFLFLSTPLSSYRRMTVLALSYFRSILP